MQICLILLLNSYYILQIIYYSYNFYKLLKKNIKPYNKF